MRSRKATATTAPPTTADGGGRHLDDARLSLTALLEDGSVPPQVRAALATELEQVRDMLDKLERGHLHIAVFGRVGVGKSALLNALLGEKRFSCSPLHGETTESAMAPWEVIEKDGVFLVDTPGINEIDGETRERLAHEVAGRSDLVLFVVEGDISDTELAALRTLLDQSRPLMLVFNKVDHYTSEDRDTVLESLRQRTRGLIPERNIVTASADPAERIYIHVEADGSEREVVRRPEPQVEGLVERLWQILEHEGKSLMALNATLFAGRLSDTLARRVVEVKQELAERLIRNYSISKGVLVGLNPVPVADLAAAIAVDVSLVVHLSRIYGLPLTRSEAGGLIRTILAQMAMLMGTVWAIHIFSSALKVGTLGLSTALTAATQGAVAYYATYVVGEAAREYLQRGKSWGSAGPKRVVQSILDSVDRDSLIAGAREEILGRIKAG